MKILNSDLKKRVAQYVNEYHYDNGEMPSLRIIAEHFGFTKPTAQRYVRAISNDGDDFKYVDGKIVSVWNNDDCNPFARAAVVGSIPCGTASDEEEHIEKYVHLPVNLFGKGEFYILKASGDSMEDAGICDGDMVVIRKQQTAKVGDIVVALDDDNCNTLKRFMGFNKKHQAILRYMNEAVYPEKEIYVSELVVQGVAEKVIKDLTHFKM